MRSLPLVACLALLIACPSTDDDDSALPPDDDDDGAPGLDLPDPWDWCPSEGSGSGDALLEVGAGALYCSAFHETRTLSEERDSKAMLRLVEGGWAIPDVDGVSAVTLPICAETEQGVAGPVTSGPGELDTATDLGGSGRYRLLLRQPLQDPDGGSWEVQAWLQGPTPDLVDAGAIDLTGDHLGLATDPERTLLLQLCEDHCLDFADGRLFDSCTFAGVTTQRHRVEFDGGWIELDLRIGQALLATQPGLFVGARGELDGQPFEQRDFWRLIYNPIHHHFSRDFAVLLDTGPAAGIEVIEADPISEAPPTQVFVIDDDLARLEERAVTGETFLPGVD